MNILQKICQGCEKIFSKALNKSKIDWEKTKYCSTKCWYKTIKGKGNPFWKPKAKRVCKECKKDFFVKQHELKHHLCIFCSVQCRAKNKEWKEERSKILIEKGSCAGKRNGAWKGGIARLPYPYEFYKAKKQVNKRDELKCGLCDKFGKETHHIDYNKKNNQLENLITLCPSCHSKTNFNREKWQQFFQEAFSNKMNRRSNTENLFKGNRP